jgi:hypothetical protein
MDDNGTQDGNSKPVPDPTKLTTDAVNAAVDISRREITALRELLGERMDAMDDARENDRHAFKERFARIEQLRIEQKADVKEAVDAALAAQKEAISKSEMATKEQIAGLSTTATTAYDSLRRDIDDLKSRVTIVESMKAGSQERRTQTSASATMWIGALGLLVAVLGLAIVVILANSAGP